MTKEKVLESVEVIFKDILENDSITVKAETTSDDIEEWDSLAHIQLVVAIEKHFNIRFTAKEIGEYANVGEMCDGISSKIS